VPAPSAGSDDVLVVVSRFKTYVRERFGMNTSDAVMEVLSDHLRAICHRAAENARNDGRKTVMDRDFEFLRRKG
jgi:histone H3/H4